MSELGNKLKEYWKNKLGKYGEELIREHGKEINSYCKVNISDLFEQLNKNEYSFKDDYESNWIDFLKNANLNEYLDINYVKDALQITTHQPAIGAGEFLFVSCFKNLGFSKESGDLIDINKKLKIEFKGNRSTLAGDGEIGYKKLSKNSILSLNKIYGINHEGSFDDKYGKIIDDKFKKSNNIDNIKKALEILQNLENYSPTLVKEFSELYLKIHDFYRTVAAMHLYTYLKLQKANYLVMTNNDKYRVFKAPENPYDAYKIVLKLKLGTWNFDKKSISVSL